MILAAAIFAYPAPWINKLLGMLIGILAIQVLNVPRIISLHYFGACSKKALDIAHF